MSSTIFENIESLKRRLKEITADFQGESVQVVLVTKTVPIERISEAYEAGVRDFGENRVQEFLKKKEKLPADICWHFIGHLQTNKVKQVLGEVTLIHSLDRPQLAQEIERQAAKKGIAGVDCLIQVNSSGEVGKEGFSPEEVLPFVRSIPTSSVLKLRGLMTIGPNTEDQGKIRQAFQSVKDLQRQLKQHSSEKDWSILSMGMSADLELAVEMGSSMIRVGSAVFGARRKP